MSNRPLMHVGAALAHGDPALRACFAVSRLTEWQGLIFRKLINLESFLWCRACKLYQSFHMKELVACGMSLVLPLSSKCPP